MMPIERAPPKARIKLKWAFSDEPKRSHAPAPSKAMSNNIKPANHMGFFERQVYCAEHAPAKDSRHNHQSALRQQGPPREDAFANHQGSTPSHAQRDADCQMHHCIECSSQSNHLLRDDEW